MWRMKVLVLFGVFVVGLSHAAVEGGPTAVPGGPTAGVGNNVTEPTHEYTTAGGGHGRTDGQVGSAATRASPSGKVEKWRTGAGNVPYSAPMQLGSKTKPLTTVSIAQNRTLPTPVTVTFGTETGSESANLWGVIIFNGLKALLSYNTTAEQKPLLDLVSGVLKYDSSNYSKQYMQSLADILEDIFVPENGTREEKLGAIAENLLNSPYVGAIVSALEQMFSRLAASPQAQPLMNALMSGQIRPADWARLLGMLVQNFNTGGNVGIPSLPTNMGILNLFKDWTGYHQLMQLVPLLLESPIERFNVGAKCHQDLFTILGGLSDRESWALRMLDAFGKPSPDLMTYQLKWIGSFDECVALKGLPWASTSGVSRHFDAQYCSVGAPITAIKVPPEAEALVTMQILVRLLVMGRLIWVYTVCKRGPVIYRGMWSSKDS